jgi:asparagine synthase (glutamine-hydrolysing)
MCGIAGIVSRGGGAPAQLDAAAQAMNRALAHRGPDDEGVWIDGEAGVALAHRRLSIVDLSPAGHQPMASADGRFVIVYNGEIYSHEDIRPSLLARGCTFRGHSDTEVILESFAAFGIAATLPNLIGMFALAVWDRKERTLTLVRDRLGIKPLYWAQFGGLFLFGSELKALRAHPGWSPQINREAVAAFMRHNYVPAPHSIYSSVHQLEPGSVLTLPYQGEPRIEKLWDARAVARQGLADPVSGSDTELTDRLEALLTDAIKRRMIADVPLGAFLSGGIDSSAVVALMQKSANRPVRTYSIGFETDGFDEARHAAAVARHLGTEHTELTVTSQQALDVIPKLAEMYDEPFADSSQIPTHLVSAMTRRHVTVALSGDGGDELFAGYNRYRLAQRAWRGLTLAPQSLRRATASAIGRVSPERWTRMLAPLALPQAGDKVHKFASVLALPDSAAVYRRLVTHWEPGEIAPGGAEPKGVLWDETVSRDIPDFLEKMQFLDLVTYLPNDILTKVDRASMAVALEVRVPLIDHRVVEFAWRLPKRAKIRGGTTKWLLRQVLYRHVPRELVERPKMGFGIPLAEWLRGPLCDWAESLLDERRLREAGLLDAALVRRYWSEHLSGTRNWQYLLWDVLMLEAWRQRWA